jgi:hypothetical protein
MTDDTEFDLVWRATVDEGTWEVSIVRTGAYSGDLRIVRIAGGQLIHSEPVDLSYGAVFGPDGFDVQMWQDLAITAIDHYNAQPRHEEQP